MDIDMSDSDMSRLTTMLTEVGATFERGYGPDGERTVEIGNIEFLFDDEGKLLRAKIDPQALHRNKPDFAADDDRSKG